MSLANPVIVVPGITATELRDEYSVSPETVWSAVLHKEYDRLALHPDNIRYELIEPARINADKIFHIVYGNLIEELRHNLTYKRDEPVPVYAFPYDWRQPLEVVERQLEAFVKEVIARTKLVRHYSKAGYADNPKVNLIGHSMGGLIISGYLQRIGKQSHVEKIVTMGTPFRGSLEAPIKIITGTASLGGEEVPSSRERETARLTPALYHLLPSFDGAIRTRPKKNLPNDLFQVDTWQEGVINTLAEYIRINGLRKGNAANRKKWARELLGNILKLSKVHRDRIESFKLEQAGLKSTSWLCLVGVDSVTRVCLQIEYKKNKKPFFSLTSKDRLNNWEKKESDLRVFTGDGTVPYLGAEPAFLEENNLVCIRPDDFGYWEIRDKLLVKSSGFHGMLPNLNLAHRLITSHFLGRAGKGIWARPAPGISKKQWNPPIKELELKE